MEEPTFYGTWKGRVIEAIVNNGALDWKGLMNYTELSSKSLNKAIAELRQAGILTETNGQYRVIPKIYKEYKACTRAHSQTLGNKV